jgi:hypothetical protein
MQTLVKVLISLSALAFVLAVIEVLFTGPIMNIVPESLSRACTNLAIIAIALSICFKEKSPVN